MAASSIAMAPPAAMNGRIGWQESPSSTIRPPLQRSLRSRSKTGHNVTSFVTCSTRSRSGWKWAKSWISASRVLGSEAASVSQLARGTTPMT